MAVTQFGARWQLAYAGEHRRIVRTLREPQRHRGTEMPTKVSIAVVPMNADQQRGTGQGETSRTQNTLRAVLAMRYLPGAVGPTALL